MTSKISTVCENQTSQSIFYNGNLVHLDQFFSIQFRSQPLFVELFTLAMSLREHFTHQSKIENPKSIITWMIMAVLKIT